MSKIYWQERNHPNWTGRVPRQARITGEWSANRKNKIPLYDVVAVAVGAALILVLLHL